MKYIPKEVALMAHAVMPVVAEIAHKHSNNPRPHAVPGQGDNAVLCQKIAMKVKVDHTGESLRTYVVVDVHVDRQQDMRNHHKLETREKSRGQRPKTVDNLETMAVLCQIQERHLDQ